MAPITCPGLAADTNRYHMQHNKIDPQQVKKISQGQRKTFADACDEYLKTHGPGKGDRWHRQFKLFTATYGKKLFREAVGTILPERIREVIAPTFARTWRQGRDTLGLWEDIFDIARTRGWRTWDNPAQWDKLHEHNFPRPSDLKVESHPSLYYSKIPTFMQTLRSYEDDYLAAIAIEIVVLTALRPNKEVRLIQWEEINFIGKVLRVPAERMKKRKDRKEAFFYVPLSDRMVALFRQLEARQLETGTKGMYVFSVRSPNKPMAEGTMIRFLRNRMGIPVEGGFDVHGFRSSFRVWGKKNKFDYEALEMCLDHVVGSQTVRADNRDDLFDERREIMDAWANYCDQQI